MPLGTILSAFFPYLKQERGNGSNTGTGIEVYYRIGESVVRWISPDMRQRGAGNKHPASSINADQQIERSTSAEGIFDGDGRNTAAIRGLDEAMQMVRHLKIGLRRDGDSGFSHGLLTEAEDEVRRKFLGSLGCR